MLRSILSARSEAEPRETEEYDHWLMILKLVDQRSPSGIGTPLNRRVRVSEEIIKALRVERSPRTVVHVESWADLEEASRRTGELIVYISKGVRPHYAVIGRNAVYVLDAERGRRRRGLRPHLERRRLGEEDNKDSRGEGE